ncbi:MAG TPA: hypothetical protein VMW24_25170, partial [Sedimentisphaerales bacterium]|nr:hypothetical protein [Sedimentisphaerales bacterium]
GQVNYLCLRLKAESKERYNIKPGGLIRRAIKAIGGDFDLVFNDQEFSTTAEVLKNEIERRLGSV